MKSRIALIFILAILVTCPRAWSQTPSQAPSRLKIGLVLEGGGAKAMAHIGVLEWFDEHQIPIDYIAGTSMGGLIGGLYAIGKSPAEIRDIIQNVNWDKLLAGQTPYRDLDFRRKEDMRMDPNGIVLGLRHGIRLPSGLNSGHEVSLLLDRYTLPYSEVKNFDDLPIPFRCVGTDLVSGNKKVFEDGPLSEALRSTMALPGIFSPVRKDGAVYADGGLLDDLPTDVVKAMGADIVIAVHLSPAPIGPNGLDSLLDVASRSIDVMVRANQLRGMALADIVITEDVAGINTLDFKKFSAIIPKGYEAASAKQKLLSQFSLDDSKWREILEQRKSRELKAVPVPLFVEVQGTRSESARAIVKALAGYVGRPIDKAQLEHALTQLTGSGRFNRLSYSITEQDGKPGLLIIADEKSYAPPMFKPGFVVDGSDPKSVQFSFGGRFTFLDMGGYRSEIRVDVSLGSLYGLGVEYYHPLTSFSHWFIAPRVDANSSAFNIYSRNTLLSEYRMNRASVGADLGYAFDRFSELRIGYELGYFDAARRIGNPLLPATSARTGATTLRFTMDRLDNPVIPRSGQRIEWKAQWVDANLGTTTGFPLSEATLQLFHPVSRPASIYLIGSGGTTFGHNLTGFPPFSLGGPARLAAYGINEFLTNQYFYFRTGYLHRLAQLPPFLGNAVYISGSYELGKAYGNQVRVSTATTCQTGGTASCRSFFPTGLPNDMAIGLAVDTVLGPAFIGGSVGDSAHRKWFFQLGRIF